MINIDGLDRLKAQLLTSGIQQENFALYQVINQLIQFLRDDITQVNAALGGGSGSGGAGILGASYLTKDKEVTLPNSRQELAGSGIQFNDAGGRRVISTALPLVIDSEPGEEGFNIPLPGIRGPCGSVGPQGIPALDGLDGETIESLIPGPAGLVGPQGLIGLSISGIDGEDGLDGVSIVGQQGIQGLVGSIGPQGIGSPGIDGIDGGDGEVYPITNGQGIPSFIAGSVIFAGPGGILTQDNANFFWDDVNNKLGIGVITPSQLLHIHGGITLFEDGGIDASLGTQIHLAAHGYPTSYLHKIESSHSAGAAGNILKFSLCNTAAGGFANVLTLWGSPATVTMPLLGAFAAGDKFVVADASGNLHLSALGPLS